MRGVSKRLLVIDDHAELRGVLAVLLRDEGFTVFEAASGVGGLQLAEREQPDVIMLDLAMPGLSGLDVLAALQRSASTRRIPVLIASGYAADLGSDTHGAAAVLQKPFDLVELLAQLERLTAAPSQIR